jgi:signal transduction histidine kinase
VKRISTRFAILLAVAGVLPLLANGATSILSLRNNSEASVRDANTNVAQRVGEQIAQYVRSSIAILNAVAANVQQTALQPWQQERILRNFALDFPQFSELTLLDQSGQAVVSSRVASPTTEIPGSDSVTILGALMSRAALDDDLLPSTLVAIRLSPGGERGWLIGRLSLEELWRTVDRIRGVGGIGYALVITDEDVLLAHGDPAAKSAVAAGRRYDGPKALVEKVRDDKQSPTGVAHAEYTNDQGVRMLGVASYLPDLRWTVIVEQPRAEAFAAADAQQRQLTVAIALSLMAMLTVGYFWGRSFINPILSLTRGTKALAEGRLDERVTVASRDELGQLGAAFNNMADRLVELQENVKKQERQAMFGRVAVGLVHDLSNPIQNIGNACKMIVMMFDDLEYRESFKRTVERELVQVKRMLDDLRNIAKPVPLQKFPLDVNKAMAELAESMQTTAESAGLTLHTELATGPLYIEGDLYALNRVYRNLLTNAFQATMARGRVTIRTIRQDEHAVIEIADTGSGIPPERLATIFDDFVTTKRRGLGLGLAISKKIVEQLGGTIAVASDVGRGTTFTIRFPLTRERPQQLAAS